jgi:hypothetical protein
MSYYGRGGNDPPPRGGGGRRPGGRGDYHGGGNKNGPAYVLAQLVVLRKQSSRCTDVSFSLLFLLPTISSVSVKRSQLPPTAFKPNIQHRWIVMLFGTSI